MKKTIAIVLSLIFVFAVTSVSFAAEAKKEAAPKAEATKEAAAPKAKAAKTVQVTGEVVAVDAKANTITVKGKKGDVVIALDDKTKMPKGKTIADVKAGDKVTVKYAEADGKNTAKNVDIKAAPAKKEDKKAATKAEEKKEAPAAAHAAPAAPKAPEKKKASGY